MNKFCVRKEKTIMIRAHTHLLLPCVYATWRKNFSLNVLATRTLDEIHRSRSKKFRKKYLIRNTKFSNNIYLRMHEVENMGNLEFTYAKGKLFNFHDSLNNGSNNCTSIIKCFCTSHTAFITFCILHRILLLLYTNESVIAVLMKHIFHLV